jgi:hypothetical protein
VGSIQDGAEKHEGYELEADTQNLLFACFQGQEIPRQKVRRNPGKKIQPNKEGDDIKQA